MSYGVQNDLIYLLSRLSEDYCKVFDLTCRIPETIIKSARDTQQLLLQPVSSTGSDDPINDTLRRISMILQQHQAKFASSSQPLRLCIPQFGSPKWGDLSPQV